MAENYLLASTGQDTDNAIQSVLYPSTEVLDKNWINVSCTVQSGVKFFRCSATPNQDMYADHDPYDVGTLSTQFRPLNNITQYVIGYSGAVQGYFYISTSGKVTFKALANIPATTGVNTNLAYI